MLYDAPYLTGNGMAVCEIPIGSCNIYEAFHMTGVDINIQRIFMRRPAELFEHPASSSLAFLDIVRPPCFPIPTWKPRTVSGQRLSTRSEWLETGGMAPTASARSGKETSGTTWGCAYAVKAPISAGVFRVPTGVYIANGPMPSRKNHWISRSISKSQH